MANEWTLVYETELPIPFTVADGAGIEKGTLLKMTNPMTGIVTDGTSGNVCAGVAAEEKIASDGKTTLAVYRRGIFKVTTSGATTVGAPFVSGSSANEIEVPVGEMNLSGAKILGHCLETGTDGQTILVQLDVGTGGGISN